MIFTLSCASLSLQNPDRYGRASNYPPPSSGSFSEPVSPLAGPERYPAAIASLAPPARIAACDAGVLPLSLNPHFAKRFADGEFNRGDGIAVLFLSRRK